MTVPARALIFHYFEGGGHPACPGSLTAEGLAGFLARFGPRRILPAAEWLARARAGALGDDDVCLSFDDGLACQMDVALPVLRDFGLTALWFPYTLPLTGAVDLNEAFRYFRALRFPELDRFYDAFDRACAASSHAGAVERGLAGFDPDTYLAQYSFYSAADRKFRYVRDEILGEAAYFEVMATLMAAEGMTPESLKHRLWITAGQLGGLAAEGHVIGMHAHQHPVRAAALSPAGREADWRANLAAVEAATGSRPDCIAYPCNCYDADAMAFLSGLGVRVGFRNLMDGAGGVMECPRQDYTHAVRDLA
ncbi:polysaccharide deacetylase family protein [Magnetospirillum sp. UT-4]|uniref:polysaccharide deacetylase family protein n=1 Tax=Magnetospirillum sp. UT-4 TaxID=2681467 RepID=UPI00137C5611|nr:polysaccharide deacetylase family protein [Magnetospirillum sp. UT-4]CAA7621674.1 conserved hypothetical protein [Magnetospirillum sp. UT-4]